MKSTSLLITLTLGLLPATLAVRSEPVLSIKRDRLLQTNIYLPAKHKSKKSKKETPAPTISAAPTESMRPSASPSVSMIPSATPSAAPTGVPSASPSGQPSSTPSISPSGYPTVSSMPTNIPFITSSSTNGAGAVSFVSGCEEPLPSTASAVRDQLIAWQYELVIADNEVYSTKIAELEEATHEKLSKRYLDCKYDDDSPFEVQRIQSEPFDILAGNCNNGVQNCVLVDAAIRMNIFYINRRLQERSDVLPDDIATALGQRLTELYSSELGVDGVVSTSFKGFTNGEGSASESNNRDVAGIQGPSDGPDKKTIFSSSFAVAGALIALIVVAVLALRRGRGKQVNERTFVLDTDSDGSPDDGMGPRVLVLSDAPEEVRSIDVGGDDGMSMAGSSFRRPQFVSTRVDDLELDRSIGDLKPRRYYHSKRQYMTDDTVDL